MGKIYRTAQGREVDIERLKLQNEMVPALGNMKVNARGDQLGSGGKILRTREQLMDEHYKSSANRTVVKPSNEPISTSSRRNAPISTSSRAASNEFNPGNVVADTEIKTDQQIAEEQTGLKGGLARAVKRAQDGTEKKGLKRI